MANASISRALAAMTGVKTTTAAKAFLNIFLLESSTAGEDSFVAASAVTARGLDVVVVVKASAEEIAMRKNTQVFRKTDMIDWNVLIASRRIEFVL